MKKCKGCGIKLQHRDREGVGYVADMNQDYCQRCFRLLHYGDTTHFKTNYVTNEKIIRIFQKYSNELFVLIIDVLDVFCLKDDDLLEMFKDYNVLLLINKTDILPENVSDAKINKILTRILFDLNKKYPNIKAAVMTNKYERAFNDQFYLILSEMKARRVVFCGWANAGKSSLINKLLHSDSLTASMYPGTTLEEIQIDYKDYQFIDTPGLVDVNNYATYLNLEKYRLSKIDRTIKPQVFQLNDPQSYFYDGLFRVDIIPEEKSSVTFYINSQNKIHRTKFDHADDYYQQHYCEFVLRIKPLGITEYEIVGKRMFIIKGLGMFKVNGKCRIRVHSLNKVKIFESEVDI